MFRINGMDVDDEMSWMSSNDMEGGQLASVGFSTWSGGGI